ncbi:MAG: two component, sigma54 specific, transcriptional regulator, Fis family [Myxococcaceae bacterium]|jgi:DNA-binding response OmpR family regulator|nr:two component, sigma54 specific, transcriptional regulator, Fis family [Myxococcaceae bacterium]
MSLPRPRLLIVEDDLSVQEALAVGLEDNYDVAVASNGEDALALLLAGPFDAVVLDLMLPGMDGVSLMRAMRERSIRVPTVLASASPLVASAARELGAVDYLAKPFTLRQIESKLARVFEQTFPVEERPTADLLVTLPPGATKDRAAKR